MSGLPPQCIYYNSILIYYTLHTYIIWLICTMVRSEEWLKLKWHSGQNVSYKYVTIKHMLSNNNMILCTYICDIRLDSRDLRIWIAKHIIVWWVCNIPINMSNVIMLYKYLYIRICLLFLCDPWCECMYTDVDDWMTDNVAIRPANPPISEYIYIRS